jgi:hypothetical protein
LNGRSIRIYLVDGDASGLLTAEVMNWSGKFVVAPRTMLKELALREEVSRTGVYILSGPDPENPSQDMIYVGEGDNVFKRITAHDKDPDKEFWTRCLAVISKDLNLTKGHVRFLESRLIEKGHLSRRARLCNGTAPPLPPMPEPDIADMEGFLSHIELVLPVLGFDFLKPRPYVHLNGGVDASNASPVFEFISGEASAKAQEIAGEFVVLKGSTALATPKDSWTSYRGLRDRLIEDQKLVAIPGRSLYLFAEDVPLKSPSAGGAIVYAGNINGRVVWKVAGTNQTYADWHQSQVPAEARNSDGE